MFSMYATGFVVLVALYLFVSERYRVDVTALIILSLLIIFNLIDSKDTLSGFSSAATVTVGAMFILSAALKKTGVVNYLGNQLTKCADNKNIFLLVLTVLVGFVSAFINNTAAVAVMLPTVLSVSKKKKFAASKFLIPLSYASQFGGVCTLIGTSTNLLVSAIAYDSGYGEFDMFEFTKLGLIMFVGGTLYFLFFGKYVLPDYKTEDLDHSYNLEKFITELRIQEKSPLIGKTLIESNLGKEYDISVLEIYRDKRAIWAFPSRILQEGDVLLIRCNFDDLISLQQNLKLESEANFKFSEESLEEHNQTLVEVMISPNSKLIGKSLAQLNFQKRYNAIVVAIRRRDTILRSKLKDHNLSVGDELLLLASKDDLSWIEKNSDFLVLKERSEDTIISSKLTLSVAILVAVVALSAFGIMPILQASIVGCLAMFLTNCITIEEGYQAIDWKVIFLLAGVLPLGMALQNSGLVNLLVDEGLHSLSNYGPTMFLAGMYLVTTVLTSFISNNAAAVLLAPIAISMAESLGVSVKPFLVAVCFAASTSFATPIGYQTNTMIYTPGGYCFKDFIRAGLPLNILFCILAIVFIPVFWPW